MTTALSFVVAGGWLIASAVAAIPLLTPRSRRPTGSEYGVAATVGACGLGVAWVLARLLSTDASARLVAIVIPVAALVVAWRRGRALLPVVTVPGLAAAMSGVVLVVWLAPVAAGAVLMGRGPYPATFFHGDTPLRLSHVRALQEPGGLPPRSLSNAGQAPSYHYGGPGVAAALATLSGLPAHTALFGVAIPLALVGLFCAARLLTAALVPPGTLLHAGLSAFVLTAWSTSLFDAARAAMRALTTRDSGAVLDFAASLWAWPQAFGNHFPDVTEAFARVLLLVAALPLVSASPRHWAAAAAAVALLGQIRSGVGLMAVILLLTAALVNWWRTKRTGPLALAAAGAGAALLIVNAGDGDPLLWFRIALEPFWLARHFRSVLLTDVLAATLLVALPGLIAAVGIARRPDRGAVVRAALPAVLAIAAVYLFYNVAGASIDERTWGWPGPDPWMPWSSWTEPLHDMPPLFALLGALLLAHAWSCLGTGLRACASVGIVAMTLLPLAHRAAGARNMLFDPERAHDYVDNLEAARAMAAIPILGTVTATNDLRYPANGYRRDQRQYQLAALFGHQTFAAPGYERYEGWRERVALQGALASTDVGCDALRRLDANGVTHLLIHKRVAHPISLPLRLLYDDESYAVFELRGLSC